MGYGVRWSDDVRYGFGVEFTESGEGGVWSTIFHLVGINGVAMSANKIYFKFCRCTPKICSRGSGRSVSFLINSV